MKIVTKILLTVALLMQSVVLLAAPSGYSVNSDEPDGDSLFVIDLANGKETAVGKVQSLGVTRSDIEGMAFDRFGRQGSSWLTINARFFWGSN